MSEMKKGILFALLAYLCWGSFPLFWKMLTHVPSSEILAARIIWAFVFTAIFIVLRGQGKVLWQDTKKLWQNQRAFWQLGAASVFISANWFTYIWAVNNGEIVQTSLGYYINPILSIIFGVIFFKEKLSPVQKIATGIAFMAVALLAIYYRELPWIALILALSFGIYGVLKKKIHLDATRGLVIETFFIVPIALGFYVYLVVQDKAVFLHHDVKTDVLLMLGGILTAIPLILFAAGAQRIPLYTIGFIQYVSPTITLLLGIFLYKEPFSSVQFAAFALVWFAIILFLSSLYLDSRKHRTH
ncbi:putative DMT superfamily transporter inner membrane protein [Metalysinibacillus saudimassiliensis]|uniref:Putative DMT superfamily transporter inner membrane protein n=1 Tax=Metalysinibacillus saudimassiliensis TaxID=1461583 RepID=A0A078M4I6_9BACL|nr:putative DMT superfamily transporter inner membrane protein [Metalysinibacillus saudimassiliensis]